MDRLNSSYNDSGPMPSRKRVFKQQYGENKSIEQSPVPPADTVCRVCLVKHLKLFPVTNDLQDVYETVTREKLNKAGYPVCMCYICLAELRKCLRFVETARDSNRVLEQWYTQPRELREVHPFRTYSITDVKTVSMGNEEVSLDCTIKVEVEDLEPEFLKTNPDTDKQYQETYNDGSDAPNDSNYTDNNDRQEAKCSLPDPVPGTSNTDISKNIFPSLNSAPSQTLKTEEPTFGKIEMEVNTESVDLTKHCELCNFKCVTDSDLSRHMQFHDSTRPHVCDVCQYRFDNFIRITKHKAMHKFDDANEYSCDRCDFKCLNKHDFTNHMIAHTDEKPISCDICNYKCRSKRRLADHMRSHTGEKPFLCEICSAKFTLKTGLETHIKSRHSNEKPFTCNYCNYKASRKDQLTRHTRTHTGEKPFSCHLCDYRFSHKGNIKQHLRAKHKIKGQKQQQL